MKFHVISPKLHIMPRAELDSINAMPGWAASLLWFIAIVFSLAAIIMIALSLYAHRKQKSRAHYWCALIAITIINLAVTLLVVPVIIAWPMSYWQLLAAAFYILEVIIIGKRFFKNWSFIKNNLSRK